MGQRGRKRNKNIQLPRNIDPEKLPKNVHWDSSGNGHWYLKYYDDEGKRRRKRIAGKEAYLSDLNRIIEAEQGVDRNTFEYIAKKFESSPKFKKLSKNTQDDYAYCLRIIKSSKTKMNVTLDKAPLSRWTRPGVRNFIDKIEAERGPSAANHVLRYVRRVFSWSCDRINGLENPAAGVEQCEERKHRVCPNELLYNKVLSFAISSPGYPYVWIVMELAYLLRLRGVEVITLTDAQELSEGVRVIRRKGSRGNITKWSPRLRAAWDAAKSLRAEKRAKKGLVTPMNPEDRWLFLSNDGHHLRSSTLSTAWQRMITKCIEQNVIDKNERFSLHSLKHRGITNTKGTRSEKKEASGHVNDSMLDIYDHSTPIVDATE